MIELKTMLTADNKKVHTDTTAEANIKAEFQDREKEVKAIKLRADLIYNKASVCEAYINIVKKVLHKIFNMKKDFAYWALTTLSWIAFAGGLLFIIYLAKMMIL